MSAAGFGTSLTDALPELRAMAESLMTLTLTAYEPGPLVDDEPSFTPQGQTFGKVQGGAASIRDTVTRTITVAGVERPVMEGGLHIPITASVPVAGLDRGKGWEYEVTAIGPEDDPALLGRRYLVVNVPAKSFATARRLDVVEVPSP